MRGQFINRLFTKKADGKLHLNAKLIVLFFLLERRRSGCDKLPLNKRTWRGCLVEKRGKRRKILDTFQSILYLE